METEGKMKKKLINIKTEFERRLSKKMNKYK